MLKPVTFNANNPRTYCINEQNFEIRSLNFIFARINNAFISKLFQIKIFTYFSSSFDFFGGKGRGRGRAEYKLLENDSLRKHKLPIYLQLPHTAVAFSENLFFGQISK